MTVSCHLCSTCQCLYLVCKSYNCLCLKFPRLVWFQPLMLPLVSRTTSRQWVGSRWWQEGELNHVGQCRHRDVHADRRDRGAHHGQPHHHVHLHLRREFDLHAGRGLAVGIVSLLLLRDTDDDWLWRHVAGQVICGGGREYVSGRHPHVVLHHSLLRFRLGAPSQ